MISQRGTLIPKGLPTYYSTKLFLKLHENEEKWAKNGGGGRLRVQKLSIWTDKN